MDIKKIINRAKEISPNRQPLMLRMPPDLLERFKKVCVANGITITKAIETLMVDFVESAEKLKK